ncbi:hypothetical protein CRG98_023836, partial [Punica granatum]
KCQPLFRLLRKNAAIEGDEECHKAFDTIKAYLVQPPVLVPPTPGRPLVLYLMVRRQSLGCMLGQEEESTHTERAIYYLGKKFTDGESNYPEIEKICCALVWVMQRLRQYTLYHTIRLLSKADPLKYLLDSPSSRRNLAKWRCQLTEYDIETSRPGTSRSVYCFQDFAYPDFASPDFASGLLLSGLRVRFTAFRTSRPQTSRPVYCFLDSGSTDFASGLLLSGLRVHFAAFRTSRPRISRPLYYFPDFASTLLLSGLRVHGFCVHFTTFQTSRPFYCFLDFASTLLLFGLRVHGFCVHFTTFQTSRPFYCFLDFASTLLLSGLRVHFTAFRTSRPHLLLFGLLVHFTAFCGLRLQHRVPIVRTIGFQEPSPGAPDFLNVPFPLATLASRVITFKGSLITPTLPCEEVVTVREPYNHAQPLFHSLLPSFLSSFRVCPGIGTFGTIHECLDLSLKRPRSLISLGVVVGASVPSSIFPGCHGRCLTGTYCP